MITEAETVRHHTGTGAGSLRYGLLEAHRSELLLLARLLLMVLFVLYGWNKFAGFSGTVGQMSRIGLPLPPLAAAVAVIMEFFVGIAIVIGFYTRPLALLLALYTLATAFIGHHYWTMAGPQHAANMINFYKNVSIFGGLLVLAVSGPGRYSIDGR